LAHDVAACESALHSYLPWTDGLDEARRGVLLNMGFNMGVVGLLGFKQFLALVHDGRYEDAARDMLGTEWAQEVGARAHRLALQMKIGEWQ
jgi:lysozyme